MSEILRPRVGVGVFVFNGDKFLIGKRKGAHGAGTWSIPGGNLDFGETPELTAAREVKKETSLLVGNIAIAAITNDIFVEDKKHYLTLWMVSQLHGGNPTVTEPDKFTDMYWTDFDNLPTPLFHPWTQLLASQYMPGLKAYAAIKNTGSIIQLPQA